MPLIASTNRPPYRVSTSATRLRACIAVRPDGTLFCRRTCAPRSRVIQIVARAPSSPPQPARAATARTSARVSRHRIRAHGAREGCTDEQAPMAADTADRTLGGALRPHRAPADVQHRPDRRRDVALVVLRLHAVAVLLADA